MSIFSSFLNGIKIVGKSVLRMFNPFEDDGYIELKTIINVVFIVQ